MGVYICGHRYVQQVQHWHPVPESWRRAHERMSGQFLAQCHTQAGFREWGCSKSSPVHQSHSPRPSANIHTARVDPCLARALAAHFSAQPLSTHPFCHYWLSCWPRAMGTSEQLVKGSLPAARKASGLQFRLFKSFNGWHFPSYIWEKCFFPFSFSLYIIEFFKKFSLNSEVATSVRWSLVSRLAPSEPPSPCWNTWAAFMATTEQTRVILTRMSRANIWCLWGGLE